jgi:hypothetical protein
MLKFTASFEDEIWWARLCRESIPSVSAKDKASFDSFRDPPVTYKEKNQY